MLDNLVTPIVAIAVILGITFPIWSLVLLARFVHQVRRIADALEVANAVDRGAFSPRPSPAARAVANSMFGR